MKNDDHYLGEAISLAMTGRGRVEPNPMVGCVLVRDWRIIGQGHHTHFGGPHAEPTALTDCAARGNSPAGATAYVTLEPCCHTNKKTPPCTPQLIKAKIARVVIGCLDPNPDVNGKGVAMLRAAGVVVDFAGEAIANQCKQLIAPFIKRTTLRLPYVTMKWAETADGKIAGPNGARLQISGAYSNKCIHELRARCDSIVVGVNTIIADDPQLTARGVENSRLRRRIILDSSLRTPPDAQVVQTARGIPTTEIRCATQTQSNAHYVAERREILQKAGVKIVEHPPDKFGRVSLDDVFSAGSFGDDSEILIEPGPTFARELFDRNVVDRLWVIRSPRKLDDPTAPAAAEIPSHFQYNAGDLWGEDNFAEYLNTKSAAFFAQGASPDVILANQNQK